MKLLVMVVVGKSNHENLMTNKAQILPAMMPTTP